MLMGQNDVAADIPLMLKWRGSLVPHVVDALFTFDLYPDLRSACVLVIKI